MAAVYLYVFVKYWKLYKFSRQLASTQRQPQTEEDIVRLAAKNPKWITVITQSIVLVCLVLLVSKLI